ncbi:DUF262 domain-containing protein [Brachyspira aalborgi]|uniref:DUF262 domain-containing protein n=1 Tax=Brachyspira aalborgi TaxID=29522 RepID=A0A5C8FTK3_9SPIR|nr:DUF262 domain-containing protein [Brachyspira aalborgi]TXJ52983.1 DUF262 domain-containing protein [Brachyspira aalborgi]
MNNINNIKELLKEEELIIPEIQRDYVWGDNELVIKRFINNIKNMKDNEELDIGFFYSYKIYENFNALIDGQQRITTLILLSWYVGVDNTKLNNFKFKVRENSNNFLEKLLEQKSAEIPAIDGKKISDKIKNSIWYKRIWDNDPTVKSILNALDIIDKELDNKKENIKNKIDNIKFSCIEAGDRRLETEYILLNKRGVNLTNSEQLKAILTEDIENKNEWLEKWEKDWQDILWECKGEDIYNTDNIWNAVLYWVRDIYVIENNICKDNDKEKINYDFDLIGIEKENKEKVLKILDWIIPLLKIINDNLDIIQEKCQFEKDSIINIKNTIQGNEKYSLTIKEKALFYSILYLINNINIKDKNIQLDTIIEFILKTHNIYIGEGTAEEIKRNIAKYNTMEIKGRDSFEGIPKTITINIAEFSGIFDEIIELEKIRIFRNLIQNSNITASNLHNVVNSLKKFNNNVYKLGELEGLNKEQQEEEALKLEIFEKYEEYKDIIIEIENNNLFKGKIKKILLLFLSIKEKDEKLNDNYKLKDFYKNKKDILVKLLENKNIEFQNLFNIYKELDLNKNKIWGELLLEDDVYKSNKNYIWLISNEEYAFLKLVYLNIINIDKNISDNSIRLEEFLNKNRKENIQNKLDIKNSEDFLKITEPKYQLYILYIIGYDNKYYIFDEIGNINKNFGIYGNGIKFENKKIEEMLKKSLFNHKLVFQSYKEIWRGGQPYVKTEEFIKEFNIQKFLEKYIK